MAITVETRTDIVEAVVGIIGAAPGANILSELADIVEGGLSIRDLTIALVNNPVFKAEYPSFLTNEEFATEYLEFILGDEVSTETMDEAITVVTALLNGGESRGSVVYEIIQFLSGTATDDPVFGDAAASLANKTQVAVAYSVTTQQSGDTLDELKAVVSGVNSSAESLETGLAVVNGTENKGGTYTFTTAQDNFKGGSGDDLFTAAFEDANTDTFTLGDTIDGSDGNDTFQLFADDANITLGGLQTKNVESFELISSNDGGLSTVNLASRSFASFTLDQSGLTDNNITIDNVLAGTDVTLTNTAGNGNGTDINFKASTAAAASQTITVSDYDLENGDMDVNVNQTFSSATTSLDLQINLMNISDNGAGEDFEIETNPQIAAEDVAVNIELNIEDVTSDDNVNVDINVGHEGGSITTATVNMTDTDNVYLTLDADDNGNGTSDEDAVTFNLDGVENSNDESTLVIDSFETVNINVLGDAEFNYIEDDNLDDNDVVVNIDAIGDLTVDGNFNFNNNPGDVTVNVTGTGDVDLGTANIGDGDAEDTAAIVADTLEGGLTVETGGHVNSVVSGSGDDDITVSVFTTSVETGAGDDTVDMNGLDYGNANAETLDGGAGTDTISISDGALLDAATAANISNFEVLDVSGATGGDTYDMEVETGLVSISATGATDALTFDNVVAGTPVSLVNGTSGFAANDVVTSLTYNLKDDSADDDALTLSLTAVDVNKNSAVAGEMDLSALVANGIESITVASNAVETETLLTAASYENEITSLSADAVETLTLVGAADVNIADVTATTLTKVDATAMTGSMTIALDASAASTVAVLGGSAADTITMTGNTAANNIIVGNGGGDIITLAAGGTKETVRYATDTDTVLTGADTDDPTDGVWNKATGYDEITNFTTGEDKIELSSALGLGSGDARSAITGLGTIGDGGIADNEELAVALQTLIDDGVDFFNDGTTDRALAQVIVDDATDFAILFIDLNNDGDFTNGVDGAIQLTGATTGIVISDVVFG